MVQIDHLIHRRRKLDQRNFQLIRSLIVQENIDPKIYRRQIPDIKVFPGGYRRRKREKE